MMRRNVRKEYISKAEKEFEWKAYLQQLCAKYRRQSVLTMSAAETLSFAQRMAMDAVRSCSLTPEEQTLYTKCVFDAAQYMQERSGAGDEEFLRRNGEMEMSSY